MPMGPIQLYVYLLMVVLMFGSPLIFIVLLVSWRKKALGKGLVFVLFACIVGAGLLQGLFYQDLDQESRQYEASQEELQTYIGGTQSTEVVLGALTGSETHGSYDYAVYQFPALDGSGQMLEVVVAPPTVNGVGYLRHSRRELPALAEARLVVWPNEIGMNPSLAPQAFFDQHVRGLDAHAYGEHTLIVQFSPRRSTIVYPPEAGAEKWLWRDAINSL